MTPRTKKKILLWSLGILLSPILLFAILTILLYLPPIQNFAVHKVADYASSKTHMQIGVEHVKLIFPLDLSVDGIKVIQPNDSLPQVHDTVADIRNMVVNVQLMPLFKSNIEIDAFEINKAKFNTTSFIPDIHLKGNIEHLYARSHGVNFDTEKAILNSAILDSAKILVELSDTAKEDSTPSHNKWKLQVLKLNVKHADITVKTPGDTLSLNAYIGKAALEDGNFDLGNSSYSVRKFDWNDGRLVYDNLFEPRVKGLDANHILLNSVNIGIDTLSYCSPNLSMSLRTCSFSEKSGIRVDDISGKIVMDSMRISLPILNLRTPDSYADAQLMMDFNAFDNNHPGLLKLRLNAQLGKQDLMLFMGSMPQKFIQKYPNYPLTVHGLVSGNMQSVNFSGLDVNLPTAFHAKAYGWAKNITNINHLKAAVHLNATTYDLGFVTCLLDPSVMNQYRIPSGMNVNGLFCANGSGYTADFVAHEGHGSVKAKAKVDTKVMKYEAQLHVNNLQLHHFMPHDSIYAFSGDVNLKGSGTDYLKKSFLLNADAKVRQLHYGHWNLDNILMDANVKNGVAHAVIDSHNKLLDGKISFDALVNIKKIVATVSADVTKADLYRMRLTERPLIAGLCGHIDLSTDMKNHHSVIGNISDMTIITDSSTYRPMDVTLNVLTTPDTTYAQVFSGNLELDVNSPDGYETIMKKGMNLYDFAMQQIKKKVINQAEIKAKLPTLRLFLMSGNDNPFANILKYYGVRFSDIFVDMDSSPAIGLNGKAHVYSLNVDSIQLDTINIEAYQDSSQVKMRGQVKNSKNNPQFVFNALFDGYLLEHGVGLNVKYFDADNKLGAMIGASAEMVDSGIVFHLQPDKPVIGYKTFNLNKDNFVFLANNKHVEADVNLIADDGTGVKVYSTPNDDALQDLTISLSRFDLEKLTSVLPYTPRMTGMMDGDFHVIQTTDQLSVNSNLSVENMTYEHSPMGNISTEFVYLPKDDGSHYVDGRLMSDNNEVMTVKGTYLNKGEGYLDAEIGMAHFPLNMVNGFVPDHLMGLNGYGEGTVTVKGPLSKPDVNGEVYLDSAHLISEPYSVDLRFDDDPVRIVGSNLLLENFEMYAHNNNPLLIYGNVNFADMNKMSMNIKMRADNYLLVDAKKTRRSELYGKMYCNFAGNISGMMDNLQMRGKLDVLGNTDITYILKDSPLTTDNQLSELVTFTDFRDTTKIVKEQPPLTGLNMDLSVSVENGANVNCDLNADHSNYVNFEGGGDLRMRYNTSDGISLTGRYTLNNGEMKYSLPVIPLKTFTIKEGSFVEFTGDVMNPKLNIIATERTRAQVGSEANNSRSVAFDVGVKVTQTLAHMGLEFTIDAPEDLTIKNELAAMSIEQRGKLAVTMLTTGMYLADGNTSGFSLNSALNSFLQSEISNITGNALKSMDLSIGMDNTTGSDGQLHTDYSFKFAKRFWNNRLSIVVGGKLSSSAQENRENNSTFFDNVSMEYRLDNTAMRYVKLFYDKSSFDLLEGQITQYGGGFVIKKKAQKFSDLFHFGKITNVLPTEELQQRADSALQKIKEKATHK